MRGTLSGCFSRETSSLCTNRSSQTLWKGNTKQIFHRMGTYIVLEWVSPASYLVRKLPFLEGAGWCGRPCKLNAAWLEHLPSTLCTHKRVESMDAHYAGLDSPAIYTPLRPPWVPSSSVATTRPKGRERGRNQRFLLEMIDEL